VIEHDPAEASPSDLDEPIAWPTFFEPGQRKRMGEQYARRLVKQPVDPPEPHRDPATEQAVLGSILLKPTLFSDVRAILEPKDFDDRDTYGIIFAHMDELYRDGQPIDLTLLIDRLRRTEDLERVGGIAHFAEIANAVPTAANAVYYAGIVQKNGFKRRLHRFGESIARKALNGVDPDTLVAQLIRDVDRLGERATTGKRFAILTSDELASADLQIDYLIEGVLVRGQPALLCGPMKTMKTTLMVAIAFCLATGLKFLGHWSVPRPVRVLVMSGESGLATLREIAERVCESASRSLCMIENLHWSDALPQLSSDRDLAELRATIKRLAIDVVVIDPAYLCMDVQDSAGNLFHMGELLGKLSGVCRETNCTPILLHHAKKGGLPDGEPLELQHIAWSGFSEFARQWILLSRREKYEPGTGDHRLWLSIGGSAGHGSLHGLDVNEGIGHGNRRWDVTLLDPSECQRGEEGRKEEAKEQRSTAKDDALLARIIGLLMKTPEGDSRRSLRDRLPAGDAAVGRAMALGVERGSLERCQIMKSRQLCDAVRIPEAGPVELTGLTGLGGTKTGQTSQEGG